MEKFWAVNWPITLSISSLLAIGTLVIYSSSKDLAIGQGIFALTGLMLFFVISRIDYRFLKGAIFPAYFVIIALLILVSVLGYETRGSLRWIPLGFFNIQPSEFAKPALILLLAAFWSKNDPNWLNIAKSFLWMMVPGFLVYKQPDLGTFLTILVIWAGMLFAARISFKKIIVLLITLSLIIPVAWFGLHNYQKQRITSFLSPGNDPLGTGYNIIQSTIAVGSGEVFGRGLGHGTQSRLQFLPEFRTDFIFASIAEELGFLGCVVILLVYLFLLSYILRMANRSADAFGYLIIFGVASMLFFQIIVNVGMNMGVFPITGITLPLISYGGSSLIATLICLGIVASIIRNQKRIDINPFEG